MYTGPNIIKNGLVFGYDTGYNSSGEQIASGRFFKGPAHTNLVEEIDPSYGTTSSTNFFNNGGATEEVDIPQVGKRNVQYVEYFNNRYAADGSVNSGTTCCPNLFHYMVDGAPYIPVDSSSSYTYSIIYKHTGGYHHPNFMYHYQKTSSNTTLTEGGVSSTSSDRRTHLGDGWYHAWGNIATQSTCTNVLLYSFLYNYGAVKHKYYVAAVSFVKNTTGETYLKIPPQLMLEPLGSVSNTASLIDLKETASIDLSNVSFDSTGQPNFDGTDDKGVVTNFPHIWDSSLSVESVVSWDDDTRSVIFGNYDQGTGGHDINFEKNPGGVLRFYWDRGSRDVYTTGNPVVTTSGAYHHVVFIRDAPANNFKFYVDGELVTTVSNAGSGISSTGSTFRFGADTRNGATVHNGSIPVIKAYNKALTATEIKQNFNAYKNRFSI